MFTFFKIGELPRGKFVFKEIEGKDWHAEVKSAKLGSDSVEWDRSRFYQERAKLKMGVAPETVLTNLKNGTEKNYKTLKQLKDSGKNPTYDVPKMPAGMNAAQTKDYFDKNSDTPINTPNTLFKILKDYFTQVGVTDKKQVEKEVLLSLHYLRWWKGINVDYLDGGEKVIIDGGHISIIKADGKTKRVEPTPLRPEAAVITPAPDSTKILPKSEPKLEPKPAGPGGETPGATGKGGLPVEIPPGVR